MSDIQGWRDRCARAMGCEYVKRPTLRHQADWWVFPDRSQMERRKWLPDEDYNQAMMMRDRAIEPWNSYKVRVYADALLDSYSPDWKTTDMQYAYLLQVAFARCTARQIAGAALKVLEAGKDE